MSHQDERTKRTMSTKPVVVYGASGYTGRLICEYLREYNLPFVAAGHRELLGVLRSFGLVMEPNLTVYH